MSIAHWTLIVIMLAFCLGFAIAAGSALGSIVVSLALLAVLSWPT